MSIEPGKATAIVVPASATRTAPARVMTAQIGSQRWRSSRSANTDANTPWSEEAEDAHGGDHTGLGRRVARATVSTDVKPLE